ncbi:hypothetical protein SUGI_0294090 [Cryptomeria japonica]|nr:hypothetical protein SUGI_0294090 [Cryptomeria japonica]
MKRASKLTVTLTYIVCFDAYESAGYRTDGGYSSPIMETVSRSRPSLSIAPGPDMWRWNKFMPLQTEWNLISSYSWWINNGNSTRRR